MPVHHLMRTLIGFVLVGLLPGAAAQASPPPAAPAGLRVAPAAQASGPQFTHLSVADGLSQSDVRSIVRDPQGFMWFATWLGGLDRYDGYTFKHYRHDPDDGRSISGDNVWVVFVDRRGELWVGTTGGGLDRYDRETDSFRHYRHRPTDPRALAGDDVKAIYEDDAGTLWVATTDGLSRYDRERDSFTTYHNDPADPASLGDNDVRTIRLDRTTGLLWLGTRHNGVSVLDRSTGRVTRYVNDPANPRSLSDDAVNHVYQDRSGTIWVSTRGGLNRFEPGSKTFVQYHPRPGNAASISDDYVSAVHEDRRGTLWVGTNNGMNVLDARRGTFTRYFADPLDPASLGDNVINTGAIYEDDTGALWIGTGYGGVTRLAGEPEKFATYRNNAGESDSLSSDNVTSLAVDRAGQLWVGTAAGIDRFDGQRFHHYVHDPGDPRSLSPGTWRMVAQDARGRMWVTTYGAGLSRLDGNRFVHYRNDPDDPDSLATDVVNGLLADRKGGLWITTQGIGLDYFDGRTFTHFAPDEDDPASLPDEYATPLLVDSDDSIWIGTVRMGLVRYDPATRKFEKYLLDPSQPDNPGVNRVEDVHRDGDTLWVAGNTGLFRFDLKARKFVRSYTTDDGLASNTLLGVLVDGQKKVWVSTTAGLSRVDPGSGTVRTYTGLDGLQGDEFARLARARGPDGLLYFGGVDGFSALRPDDLPDNPTPPPVAFTGFELFNEPVTIGAKGSPLKRSINTADEITLSHDQSVIRIQFAALNLTRPQRNRYAYRLEGVDRGWQYVDATERFATYTSLAPGDYTFRVKAANNDGVWNEQGVSLTIVVEPPWWATWWFRTGVVIALIALALAGHRWRLRSIERRSHELEHLVDERTAELVATNKDLEAFSYSVSHDLRAPLRAIGGFADVLTRRQTGLDEQSRHYLDNIVKSSQRMTQLITDLLAYSRVGRSEIRREPVPLNDVIGPITEDLAARVSEVGGGLEVTPELPVVRGDRSLLTQIFTNLLDNALTYRRPEVPVRVSVGAEMDNGMAVVRVSDNGMGIPAEHQQKIFDVFQRLHGPDTIPGTGIGLATVKRSVEALDGRLRVESEPGRGSTFYVWLPRE